MSPYRSWPIVFCVGLLAGVALATPQAPTATVRSAAQASPLVSPAGTTVLYPLARGQNAFVGVMEMQAGAVVPVHRDATEEYIYVLGGGGSMRIDGVPYEVKQGDLVYMPAQAQVSFTAGSARTTALQIFAGPEPADKYSSWAPKP